LIPASISHNFLVQSNREKFASEEKNGEVMPAVGLEKNSYPFVVAVTRSNSRVMQ
jgi:hypothetical protein